MKRFIRRCGALIAIAVLMTLGLPTTAWAADDQIDSWKMTYTVDQSGTLNVSETIVFRFGSSSGRHGMDRTLVTREPWGQTDQDVVYQVDNITVSSPDASSDFRTMTLGEGRRTQNLRIRIGDANKTITTPTATYMLNYDIKGAIRNSANYDELYWDLASDGGASVRNLKATISVPGGVQEVNCHSGPKGTRNPCDSASIVGERAVISQMSKSSSEITSVGVKITSGLIANNTPQLEPKIIENKSKSLSLVPWIIPGAIGLGVISFLLGGVKLRRDLRFLNVPPGTIPPNYQNSPVGKSPRKVTIPVRFTPPNMSPVDAAFMLKGTLGPSAIAALMVRLATKHVWKISSASEKRFFSSDNRTLLSLVDPTKAAPGYERMLLEKVFPPLPYPVSGPRIEEFDRTVATSAYRKLSKQVSQNIQRSGWYDKMPSKNTSGSIPGFVFLVIAVFIFTPLYFGFTVIVGSSLFTVLAFGAVISIVIGLVAVTFLSSRRSAVGRALTDQIEGFKEYISTAEADQLKWEEGVDIFSAYLPWAIIFGEAERWTRVCQELIDMGRLDADLSWYVSPTGMFSLSDLNSSISSMTSAATVSSGGTSSGSSFSSGGGFSGGGGGGGSASSW